MILSKGITNIIAGLFVTLALVGMSQAEPVNRQGANSNMENTSLIFSQIDVYAATDDDYILSIGVDSGLFDRQYLDYLKDYISGTVDIYHRESGELLYTIEIGKDIASVGNYTSDSITYYRFTNDYIELKKGHYILVPKIYAKRQMIKDYVLGFYARGWVK